MKRRALLEYAGAEGSLPEDTGRAVACLDAWVCAVVACGKAADEGPLPELGVELMVLPSRDAVAEAAAGRVVAALRAEPGTVLCCAAGATPTPLYALLAAAAAREPELFQHLRVVQLDECAQAIGNVFKG